MDGAAVEKRVAAVTGSISALNSTRLAALRFPLIVLVIYIHARAGTVTFGDKTLVLRSQLVDTVKAAISDGIARTAVPLFFLLSGYLLFHAQRTWSWNTFGDKLKRRFHTLVIPYLFWNALLYVVLLAAQATPLRVFFNSSGVIADMSADAQVRWVLGAQRYPIAYQFWFIRDLFLLVLAGPLLFFLARREVIAAMIIAVLGTCWMIDWWPISVPAIEAILFFFVGIAAGLHSRDLFVGPPLLVSLSVYGALLAGYLFSRGTAVESLVQHLLVLTGIFVALGIVRNLPARINERIASLAGASFFVFAVHEPITTTLLKISYRVLPPTPVVVLLAYLLVPVLVVAITLTLYRIAMALAPALTRRVTGR